MSHEQDGCLVANMEAAVVQHVAIVFEAAAAAGLDSDRVTAYIADKVVSAARAGIAVGTAGVAASAAIEENR